MLLGSRLLRLLRVGWLCCPALLLLVVRVLAGVEPQSPPAAFGCATGLLEAYHKGTGPLTAAEARLAATLQARPDSVGYLQSETYPIRVHYPDTTWVEMAGQVLEILETSWAVQVGQMGFYPPPADCSEGGSDDLDVYLDSNLPTGVGGYTSFVCYDETTARADAASFIVLSTTLTQANIRGATTHEFFHACENAMDWWEHITFKENCATWVMDRMYDDENYYFNYLQAYQRHPYWAIQHFSTSDTYQYGECLLIHFLSEYYDGSATDFLREVWEACIQDPMANEPDYLDALQTVLNSRTGGLDGLPEALAEFSVWRYACATRDDGLHFLDGPEWGSGAAVVMDTEVDLAALPFVGAPAHPPEDYGFSYFALAGTPPAEGLAIEFDGDEAVSWAVGVIQVREEPLRYVYHPMTVQAGHGLLLLGPQVVQAASGLVVAVINLSTLDFDPEGNYGDPRDFVLAVSEASAQDTINLWPDRPIHGSLEQFGLSIGLEHEGAAEQGQLYVVAESAGTFLFLTDEPTYPSFTALPVAFGLPLGPGLFGEGTILDLTLPELGITAALRWHAALLAGDTLLDYTSTRTNFAPQRREHGQ